MIWHSDRVRLAMQLAWWPRFFLVSFYLDDFEDFSTSHVYAWSDSDVGIWNNSVLALIAILVGRHRYLFILARVCIISLESKRVVLKRSDCDATSVAAELLMVDSNEMIISNTFIISLCLYISLLLFLHCFLLLVWNSYFMIPRQWNNKNSFMYE
jgi:hypothetical protein